MARIVASFFLLILLLIVLNKLFSTFKLSKFWQWIKKRQKAAVVIKKDEALYCYFLNS